MSSHLYTELCPCYLCFLRKAVHVHFHDFLWNIKVFDDFSKLLDGMYSWIRHGLAVRIAGSHPAGPGSTPGVGNQFLLYDASINVSKVSFKISIGYHMAVDAQHIGDKLSNIIFVFITILPRYVYHIWW